VTCQSKQAELLTNVATSKAKLDVCTRSLLTLGNCNPSTHVTLSVVTSMLDLFQPPGLENGISVRDYRKSRLLDFGSGEFNFSKVNKEVVITCLSECLIAFRCYETADELLQHLQKSPCTIFW
jgi:hypothetical protein